MPSGKYRNLQNVRTLSPHSFIRNQAHSACCVSSAAVTAHGSKLRVFRAVLNTSHKRLNGSCRYACTDATEYNSASPLQGLFRSTLRFCCSQSLARAKQSVTQGQTAFSLRDPAAPRATQPVPAARSGSPALPLQNPHPVLRSRRELHPATPRRRSWGTSTVTPSLPQIDSRAAAPASGHRCCAEYRYTTAGTDLGTRDHP